MAWTQKQLEIRDRLRAKGDPRWHRLRPSLSGQLLEYTDAELAEEARVRDDIRLRLLMGG